MTVFPLRRNQTDAVAKRQLAAEMRSHISSLEAELSRPSPVVARQLSTYTRARALAILTQALGGTADRLDAEAEMLSL